MKVKLLLFFALMNIFWACDSSEPIEKSIFEGKWHWVETNGTETDGTPFYKDPESEGYQWSFLFYDSKGTKGKLQTYKDEIEDILYGYEYTVSSDPLQQKLILTNLQGGSGLPEIYYWEVSKIDNEKHLYLRNAGYFNEGCCNLKIEHNFVLE